MIESETTFDDLPIPPGVDSVDDPITLSDDDEHGPATPTGWILGGTAVLAVSGIGAGVLGLLLVSALAVAASPASEPALTLLGVP